VAVFPVFDGDELVALLYVDSAEPHFCQGSDVERLAKFAGMLARAVRPEAAPTEATPDAGEAMAWEAYLERTPVQDIERQKLLLLLDRNDWNIARVARLMGVTRRTVYLRLQRYNIPRQRVYKTRLGSAAAS
jgi:transcriptional regulator with GAF, ATPase, and Fis domain